MCVTTSAGNKPINCLQVCYHLDLVLTPYWVYQRLAGQFGEMKLSKDSNSLPFRREAIALATVPLTHIFISLRFII